MRGRSNEYQSHQRRIRIFCFPPSGAQGKAYDLWREHQPATIDIVGVDYPGRGLRFSEAPITHMETLAETLARALVPTADLPFALLGHSMGGLVAFEAARFLTERNRPPLHVFICASRPPGQNMQTLIHHLPDEELVAELDRRVGQKRSGVQGLALSLLRADVTAAERYWAPPERVLACPMSVLGAVEDKLLPRSSLAQWCLRTTGRVSLEVLPGGHFFRSNLSQVVSVVAAELERTVAELALPV